MSGYVQNHVLDAGVLGFPAYCAGMPILWFDRAETSAAMGQSDDYMTGAYEDEPNFMKGRSEGMPCREVVLKPGPAITQESAEGKVIVLARKQERVASDAFLGLLDGSSEPLLDWEGSEPVRTVRSVCLAPGDRATSPFDVAEEYWWPSGTQGGSVRVGARAAEVLEADSIAAMRIEEVRAVWGKSVSYET